MCLWFRSVVPACVLLVTASRAGAVMTTALFYSAASPPPDAPVHVSEHQVSMWMDASLISNHPCDTLGMSEVLSLDRGHRVALDFDTVGTHVSNVTQAVLYLYNVAGGDWVPVDWRANLITNPWLEFEASWSNRMAAVRWDTPGGDVLAAGSASGTVWCVDEEYHAFDVSPLLLVTTTNPNTYSGFLIATDDEDGEPYYMSADNAVYDTNQQPYLVVVYDNGLPEWTEAAFQAFTIQLSNDYSTVILGWTNYVCADIHACTNFNYSTEPDDWYVRAAAVSGRWADVHASNHVTVYYQLVSRPSGAYTSTYAVGKETLTIQQSRNGLARQNWVSCPFAFMDDYGTTVTHKNFDQLMLRMCLTPEGPAIRRDAVQSQPSIGDDPKQATCSFTAWGCNDPSATNWYWNKMYKIVVGTSHTGAPQRLTFVGKVHSEATLALGLVQQSRNGLKRQNWLAYPYSCCETFDAAHLADVMTPEGPAIKRDAVQSQPVIGGNPQQATLSLGGWVATDPAATNCMPSRGYSIIISTNHTGSAAAWSCPNPLAP